VITLTLGTLTKWERNRLKESFDNIVNSYAFVTPKPHYRLHGIEGKTWFVDCSREFLEFYICEKEYGKVALS